MEFKKATTGHSAIMGEYISGDYKVVKYGKYWYAYVKEPSTKIWGCLVFVHPSERVKNTRRGNRRKRPVKNISKWRVHHD